MKSDVNVLTSARRIMLLMILFVISHVFGRASGGDFTPLMTSLKQFIGDKGYWSFEDNVLTGNGEDHLTENKLLLSKERFHNFILKFVARSTGKPVQVLFRASILPPGMIVAYEAEVGGPHAGSLNLRKPVPFSPKADPEGGHAAQGFPDALTMPFLREAADSPLVRCETSPAPAGQWGQYEIAVLGDHIVVKINGVTTAHYRDEKGLEEGMLGFALPSPGGTKAELKDLQIELLGDVRWPTQAPAGNLGGAAAGGWTASPAEVRRIGEEAWIRESQDLIRLAGNDAGFHSLFDGKSLKGWRDANTSWSVTDGHIEGFTHNSFLVTEKEYSDFFLKGFVRLTPPGGNSGVQVRSEVIPDGMKGYQFDMGVPWWGQLYHESTRRGILVPVDDRQKRINLVHTDGWNEFLIICKGYHLIGKLNGEVTYDFVDYYGEKTGRIGLQLHLGPPMKVEFRDIRIKELP